MNISKLNDWLQVIGTFGVLAGLIFVGMQLQQEQRIAQASRIQAASEAGRAWAELIAEHPAVWVKGLAGETLAPDEQAAFDALAASRELSLWSGWFGAQLLGEPGVTRDSFVRDAALQFSANPGLLRFWREHSDRMALVGRYGEWQELVNAEIQRLEIASGRLVEDIVSEDRDR